MHGHNLVRFATIVIMEFLLNTIINAFEDGIIVIDRDGFITHFNPEAGRITGIPVKDAIGHPAAEILPNARLHIVLKTGIPEVNQEQIISKDLEVVASRVPVFDDQGKVTGAVHFFRDITRVKELTDQNISLKKMQSLLEAIINASEDAISVVDERGIGMMINPAYTRITGLASKDILGKPASEDIAEGESVHMQVLRTCEPVKGAYLKVGPQRKDVMVNVAPVTVDGHLKGSVAVIHDISELKRITEELTKAMRIIRTITAKYTFGDILGESGQMKIAVNLAKKAARIPATVLLRGESGTGKELFAHAIHNASHRKNNQFIRVNCAAIVDNLFESELFGYEEGSFTGARRGGKRGLFEAANSGTFFFDEISELSMNTQAKLLRVLQEKEIVRVGGTKAIPVDVRVIAATHVDLEKAVDENRFREDLYYRLNVMPIMIPPLRQRKGDIKILVHHVIRKLNQDFGRNVAGIDHRTLPILEQYPWPGNVRELENILAQSMIKMRFNESNLLPKHLPDLKDSTDSGPQQGSGNESPHADYVEDGSQRDLRSILESKEREHISGVLSETRGNKAKAARILKISIRNLYNKIEKYDLRI